MPPRTERDDGQPRRVGVEIELGGLTVEQTAEAIRSTFGGQVVIESTFCVNVRATIFGDFRVELDAALLRAEKYHKVLDSVGIDEESAAARAFDELIEAAAGQVVPCEVVTSPLRFEQLPHLDDLREVLLATGARGTKAAPWYAFGVHFNPELVSPEPGSLMRYLQAFFLLEPKIRKEEHVDWSRRLTPYVDPFPDAYIERLLARSSVPTRPELVREYLEFNPSRNRSLDMLPAFMTLEPAIVAEFVDDPLIRARPTFHYRLANSRVDEPEWTLAEAWNRWVEVEVLAESPPGLRRRAERWLAEHRKDS